MYPVASRVVANCLLLGMFGDCQRLKGAEASPATVPDKQLPLAGEVFTVEGHTAFVILPKQPAADVPTSWVWYAPTLPGLPADSEKWMFQKFLAARIAIVGVDVGESYGSPGGRFAYSALYKELVEKRGFARKACLLARSRGGLMLYCWAAENPEKVACLAGIYPVCNLRSYPGLAKACGKRCQEPLFGSSLADSTANH
jgi:hypothetical protein